MRCKHRTHACKENKKNKKILQITFGIWIYNIALSHTYSQYDWSKAEIPPIQCQMALATLV